MASELENRSIDVGGTKINYVEMGAGPPVILVHGGGPGASGLSNYRKNITVFAEKNRVIVPDLPGYGASENKYPKAPIFTTLGNVIVGVMDALHVERADLVGNSLGGGASLRAAFDHPERVGKLVLMGPGGSSAVHTPMPTEGLLRMLTYYAGEGPSLEKIRKVLELLVYDISTITPELLQERLEASSRPDVIKAPPLMNLIANYPEDQLWRLPLEKLTHETLLIWGREDRVVPLDAYVPLLKTIPNARLHVFPKCGHWAQWEKADEFNELVLNFLAR